MIPLILFLLPALAPTSLVPQDEKQDERADVAERLDQLAAHLKERGDEDLQAIAILDGLTREFQEYGPKDRQAVVKALDGCFKEKRAKELEEGVPDDRLYYAAATALGEMGPESVKPLLSWLEHKSHRKNVRLQVRITKSLGKTGDEAVRKPLVELLKHKNKELQAAGAEALATFSTAPLDDRKDIFKELLDVLMAQKAKKDADVSDLEAFERWSTISGPFIATMQALSGHDEREAEAWQRWWNKNKKEDWDKK